MTVERIDWQLGPPRGLSLEGGDPKARPAGSGRFLAALADALAEVDGRQKRADAAFLDFAAGRSEDPNALAVEMKKAELSFRYLLAVRRKVIEAYQELTRLNV